MLGTQQPRPCATSGRALVSQPFRASPRAARKQAVSFQPRPSSSRRSAQPLRVHAFQTATTTSAPVPAAAAVEPSVDRRPRSTFGADKKARMSWAGAGIFFFWQLGALKYLGQHFDLTRVPMAGASGGALAAVLAACGVDPDTVLERAYAMSKAEGVWDRRFGLLGIWGSLVERWLDHLLPDNAAELCRNRVTVVVTTLPQLQQVGISDFRDKQDLINICMASSHVPLFLDFKFARKVRGQYCFDGSLPDFFYNKNCDILQADAVIFDYFDDPGLNRSGRFEMLSLKSYEEVLRINQCGYDFARRLDEKGMLQAFTKSAFGASFDSMSEDERSAEAPASTLPTFRTTPRPTPVPPAGDVGTSGAGSH